MSQNLLFTNWDPLMADNHSARLDELEFLVDRGFQVEFHSHAHAILKVDFPVLLDEIALLLSDLTIPIETIVRGGGGEHATTQELRRRLTDMGWNKHKFEIRKLIDGVEREFISHEVDHVRSLESGKIALEIEWNNKDPFFDRDLENFKRIHMEGAMSVGIIITRGARLENGSVSAIRSR